jgi:glycosyltransferase involved in cell wall biosynthesis
VSVGLKVFFEASSVLASYNLALPNAISSEASVIVDIEHPLLLAIYLYERLHGRFERFRAVPPHIGRLVRPLALRKADVVHLNSLNIELAKQAKRLGKHVIMVLHAAPFPEKSYDVINDYIDVYVAPSYFTRQNEEGKMGSKEVVVIHHGVDTALFNTSIAREEARRKIGIPLNAKVVLWNDRISPEKDLETFVRAVQYVLNEVKEAYVYIKGRTVVNSYYEKIKGSLKNLSKSGKVKIHIGWIPQSKLPLLYRASDVFVRTSKYENFGLGVIESMACGTPLVAPNAATFPEILCDKTTLYEPENPLDLANRLLMLLTDYNLYRTVRDRQLEKVRKLFDIKIVARKYVELYNHLRSSNQQSRFYVESS